MTLREKLTPPFWVGMALALLVIAVGVAGATEILPREPALFAMRLLIIPGALIPALMMRLNKEWGHTARRAREDSWRNFHEGTGWRRWLGLPSNRRPRHRSERKQRG